MNEALPKICFCPHSFPLLTWKLFKYLMTTIMHYLYLNFFNIKHPQFPICCF